MKSPYKNFTKKRFDAIMQNLPDIEIQLENFGDGEFVFKGTKEYEIKDLLIEIDFYCMQKIKHTGGLIDPPEAEVIDELTDVTKIKITFENGQEFEMSDWSYNILANAIKERVYYL